MSTVMSNAKVSDSPIVTSGNSTCWVPISTEKVRTATGAEHTEAVTIDRMPLSRSLATTMLATAYDEACRGRDEGGIPIGAALYRRDGELLGVGHNRRVQDNDASTHAETDAFRRAGRRRDYAQCVMVTTLSPCWYCAGLVRQFGIGAVVIGETTNFSGGHDWLRENGVEIVLLDDPACTQLLGDFIHQFPELWDEDIGR